jgi:hypothetical protein
MRFVHFELVGKKLGVRRQKLVRSETGMVGHREGSAGLISKQVSAPVGIDANNRRPGTVMPCTRPMRGSIRICGAVGVAAGSGVCRHNTITGPIN